MRYLIAFLFAAVLASCGSYSISTVPANEINLQANAKQQKEETVDIETSSDGPVLTEDTKTKLKKKGMKIRHQFSNKVKLTYTTMPRGDVFISDGPDSSHGLLANVIADDLPKYIAASEQYLQNEREGKPGNSSLSSKGVGTNPNFCIQPAYFLWWVVGCNLSQGKLKWPNNQIPYIIDSGFTGTQVNNILNSINHWNARMNVKWVGHTGQWNVVHFTNSSAVTDTPCSSNLGNIGNLAAFGGQTLYLSNGCANDFSSSVNAGRSILHEMGHAAGMWHEQQRCDRDLYVTMNFNASDAQQEVNYGARCMPLWLQYGSYDFDSTMHYSYNSRVIKKPSQPTSYFTGNWTTPGTAYLSAGDISAMNTLYQ